MAIMFLEIFAALFHFDEHDWFPDVIGEGRAPPSSLDLQMQFRCAADLVGTPRDGRTKQSVKEDLPSPFFIAGDAALIPFNERGKLFGVRHGGVLRE